jgi:hypothetical protein
MRVAPPSYVCVQISPLLSHEAGFMAGVADLLDILFQFWIE